MRAALTGDPSDFRCLRGRGPAPHCGPVPGRPEWPKLVERLRERSDRFRELRERHEIAGHDAGTKWITHSAIGLLELDCANLQSPSRRAGGHHQISAGAPVRRAAATARDGEPSRCAQSAA
ncbi:MmyB family transcriptional regulator [Streptomyces cinereospinus]|uniref:MmyB-like transcription regulator ligand binding domain-containing protein n=1 Tax=Streptomyces cinereospinus TaxID=285561 RepID=A0ABV5N8T3_9ACTN